MASSPRGSRSSKRKGYWSCQWRRSFAPRLPAAPVIRMAGVAFMVFTSGAFRMVTKDQDSNNRHPVCTLVALRRLLRDGRGDLRYIHPGDSFMNEARKDLVIGVFEQEAQAEQAVAALWKAGF